MNNSNFIIAQNKTVRTLKKKKDICVRFNFKYDEVEQYVQLCAKVVCTATVYKTPKSMASPPFGVQVAS